MAILIQTQCFPQDWKTKVQSHDINHLSSQTQFIIGLYKEQIDKQDKEALGDKRIVSFVNDLIFNNANLLESTDKNWSKLPQDLVKDVTSEFGDIGNIWEFSKRHDSMFQEFSAYSKLLDEGYIWKTFKRSQGSCDLTMQKGGETYNIEVKFKESEDTFLSRIGMYLNGMSLLDDYAFIRGKKITVDLKRRKLDNSTRKEIIKETKLFLSKQELPFTGTYICIYEGYIPPRNGPIIRDKNGHYDNPLAGLIINETKNKEDVCVLIDKIFLRNDGHIDKMKKKFEKNPNFIGFLSWSHPFYDEISISEIEQCFMDLKLRFTLYVHIYGYGLNNFDVFLKIPSPR